MQFTDCELMQNLPIFGGINAATIELILELSSLVNRRKGEYFFREGDQGASTFVLKSGNATILKSSEDSECLLGEINEGDCFGEMAIIDYMPRSASVRAESDASAIEISAQVLHEIYKRDPEQFTLIQMNMAREVSRRLRDVSNRLFDYESQNNQ